MIQLCRAEDGHAFQVNATLRDIERLGSLEVFVHQETGVAEELVLAYLSDGRRLTNTNLRELAGSQDQTIFVYNKYFLDCDTNEVLQELRVVAALQPPIEDSIAATPPFRPAQLAASYLRTAHLHHDHILQTLATLRNQHEAIRIASTTLDHHVLAIVDTFDGIAAGCRGELEKQTALLAGLETDLELVRKVKIHIEFMSPAVRRAIEAGEKHRTLGDYVSNVKMRQVGDTCARTHDDLRSRFTQVEQAIKRLTRGTDGVRTAVSSIQLLEEADSCRRRAQEIFDKITEWVTALEGFVSDPDSIIQELRRLDAALRDEVEFTAETKNAYTELCIGVLRDISLLNNEIVQIPPALAGLQASFRGKNSFSHIQRLHHMLYAYGATVIEIVRRKEFSSFFYQRAQSILEVMAKLSASERKRRQVYRGEVHGQLPFETRGMDDAVPSIDFSPSGTSDAPYSLERNDVDALLRVFDELEQYARAQNDSTALAAIRDCRSALDKLVVRMDSLEVGFDRIAERSLLSASRLSSSRRRSLEADEQAYHELAEQLKATEQAKAQMELDFRTEREALETEIQLLQSNFREAETAISGEHERTDKLERELHQVQAQVEAERATRRILEKRNAELSTDIETQRLGLGEALAAATDHSRTAELLRQELVQVRAEFEDVKALETRNADKVANLLDEQANNLRILEEARARGDDLEAQIRAARAENEDVNRALKDSSAEKDRLLRAQASEHDRIIRDHIAEADGDRAVLDRQFFELKAVQEHTERQVKDLQAEVDVARSDGLGLREELQRVEHELREARHVEKLLRDDLKTGQASQSDFEQKLEDDGRLIAQILDVAINFRNSHVKALAAAQAVTAHPGSRPSANLAESVFSSSMRHNIIGQIEEPSPIDPADPAAALEALRTFDHDHFLEAVVKTGSTVRKWQKQCKEYRERAKGKISFRNFAKGDLALFLPTRNSVSKPWAAFNVSFPHYFLQATGHLAEQLKTREWIVARITSITERVVDNKDPTSNPYGLGDGVKYYMLEVEDWTQPSHNKRRVSPRKQSIETEPKELLLASSTPALPPGPEVEDTFRDTHPPNSHLFPVRTRSNSSPTARPSSLSRLLAQATPDASPDANPTPQSGPPRQSSPPPPPPATTSPPAPPSPSQFTGSIPQHVTNASSPLRPGSRASRMSTASKFSGRIPTLGAASNSPSAAKAAPTIALSEEPLISSSGSSGDANNPFGSPVTTSPPEEESISEIATIPNQMKDRRRTVSSHISRTSPLATNIPLSNESIGMSRPTLRAAGTLASLANSWGVSFGRRRQTELGSIAGVVESPSDARGSSDRAATDASASELLKRF